MFRKRPGVRALVLIATCTFVVWSQEDAAAPLPDGTGKMVTARVCGKCHTVEKFATERKTKAEWDDIINKMSDEEGLEITEDEYNTVIAYLAKYLGKPEKK
jgi:cytochrome c5